MFPRVEIKRWKVLNWTVQDGAYGKLFLGRAVSEQSDIVFFYPMDFLRGNLSTALYFDFLQLNLKKCCDLFFTFGFL